MECKGQVTHDYLTGWTEIRMIAKHNGTTYAATRVNEDGSIVLEQHPEGTVVPAVLRMPRDFALELQAALNDHAPVQQDADLREALKVERARVDKIIDKVVE